MRTAAGLGICLFLISATALWAPGQDKAAPKGSDVQRDKSARGKDKGAKGTSATAGVSLKVMKEFKAELLYSVPKESEGSWVNMCVDPKGRLIVSDQYGPLYRITPPPMDGKPQDGTKVEKLDIP